MMANVFQNNDSNNHKRGLAEMMAPPPTPTAPGPYRNSSSYLDCQSLQSSLKRVRLSSSPGELRLQRDLRHMVSSGTWVPQQNQDDSSGSTTGEGVWIWHPPEPPVTAKSQHQPPPPHIELQQVEALRLRLTFQHSVVAFIQVPRMYPHRPPLISRIVYNNNYGNTSNIIPYSLSGPPSPNNMQTIQSILVHEALPGRPDGGADSPTLATVEANPETNKSHNTDNTIQCSITVVYPSWSPVQRLGDLLEFVIATLQRQHEHLHGNNNNNNNKRTNHHASINDVPLTYSSSSLSSNSSWSGHPSHSSVSTASSANTAGYRTSNSSIFPGWKEEHSSKTQFHQEQQQHQHHHMDVNMMNCHDIDLASSFLTPNRFDVGYDRVVPSMTMDVEVSNVGAPQHTTMAMMDL
jgi:hypothetical protein